MKESGKAVLITGCSSGIGHACVKYFAQSGFKVFAGVRTIEDSEMVGSLGKNIIPLIIDVTDQGSIDSALEIVKERMEGERFQLINNAGMAVSCPVEFVEIEKLKQQFDVNIFGHIRLIQKFLPILRETRGRIINISSFLSTLHLPYTGPYCASKAALNAINTGLGMELKKWGIDVVLVMPGIVNTPIWVKSSGEAREGLRKISEQAGCYYGEEFEILTIISEWLGKKGISAEKVAQRILQISLSKKVKPVYYIGYDSILSNFLRKFPQKVLDQVVIGVINLGVYLYKKRIKRG